MIFLKIICLFAALAAAAWGAIMYLGANISGSRGSQYDWYVGVGGWLFTGGVAGLIGAIMWMAK